MKFVAAESVHKVPKTGGPKSAILRGGSRVVGSGRVGPGRAGLGRDDSTFCTHSEQHGASRPKVNLHKWV